MSSTAPVADVAEVLIRCTVNSKPVELCLWFHSHAGPITTARLTTIASRVRNAYRFNFAGSLGSHLMREVIAIDRSPGSSLFIVAPVNLTLGFGGSASPNAIALRILNQTDLVPSYPKSSSFI